MCSTCADRRRRTEEHARLAAALEAIPAKHERAAFGSDELARFVRSDRAEALAERSAEQMLVTMYGRSGAGKSSLAAAMVRRVVERAAEGHAWARRRVVGVRWIPAWALGEARSQHALGADEAPLVVAAMNATLLVLDDLGKEAPRKRDGVVHVLHARWSKDLPTYVTTELDAEAVARSYSSDETNGEHLARRLFSPPAVAIRVEVPR
jgi:DNA replication protein DnaC